MSSSYRNSLTSFLADLEINTDVVYDCGGSQLPLPKRVKKWFANKYVILDLPSPHEGSPKSDIALDMNYSEYYFTGRPDLELQDHQDRADIVFCLETFDYLYHPLAGMGVIDCLLKHGGIAYISSGLIYPTHNPMGEDCLRYTEFAIRKLAERVGLEVEEMIPRRPETDAIELLWRSERLRAAKHYDHNTLGFITKLRKPE